MSEQDIKVGQVWRHWKGGRYRVLALAREEARPDQHLVIYQSVATPEGEVWARTVDAWLEDIPGTGPRFVREST